MAKALILTTNVILGFDLGDALNEHDPTLQVRVVETEDALLDSLGAGGSVAFVCIALPFDAVPSEALLRTLGACEARIVILGAEDPAPYAGIVAAEFLPMPFTLAQLRTLLSRTNPGAVPREDPPPR